MKSLRGFLRTRYLRRKLDQSPPVVTARAGKAEVGVDFAVHTWFEYHHRARDSYTGEPDMVAWLERNARAGEVLWDVGANVGAYSLLAAKLAPEMRVISFEPFIPTFAHLWENVVLNGCTGRVTPLWLGLSDETRIDTLGVHDPRAGSADHEFGAPAGAGGISQSVIALRGDDALARFGIPAPTLLKIDTDGHEIPVLRGMPQLLRGERLRSVMIEVDESKSLREAEAILTGAGFSRKENPLTKPTGGVFNVLFERS